MFKNRTETNQDSTNFHNMSSDDDRDMSVISESSEYFAPNTKTKYEDEYYGPGRNASEGRERVMPVESNFRRMVDAGTNNFRGDATRSRSNINNFLYDSYTSQYGARPGYEERYGRWEDGRYPLSSIGRGSERYYEQPENGGLNRPHDQKANKIGPSDPADLDTPAMSVEGKGVHFNPEYIERSGSIPEFDEKLISLRFLMMYAEIEARKMVSSRVKKHLEANEEMEKSMEMRRKKKEILGIGKKDESTSRAEAGRERNKARAASMDSSEDELDAKEARRLKIGSFADFENSMFTYKSKNGIKTYTCPYQGCGMELPTLSRIKRHYIVHTKLRPFKCLNKDCNKRFSRKDNMLQHYKIHCNYSGYR